MVQVVGVVSPIKMGGEPTEINVYSFMTIAS